MKIIIFDTETTGLLLPSRVPVAKQPRVIEFAALLCEGPTILDTWSTLIDPEIPLPAIITKITGLTDADVTGQPKFAEVLRDIVGCFEGKEMAVGHNINFDYQMIKNELYRAQYGGTFPWPERMLCTIAQYEHLFGRWLKQGELYEHFMQKPQAKAHRAMDDILALHECLVAANFFAEVADA